MWRYVFVASAPGSSFAQARLVMAAARCDRFALIAGGFTRVGHVTVGRNLLKLVCRQRGGMSATEQLRATGGSHQRLHLKPPQYLNTIRDVTDLSMLAELQTRVVQFLQRRLGTADVEMWFHYPTNPGKSTLHLHISRNVADDAKATELNRRIMLSEAVCGTHLQRQLWWYHVHPASNAWQLMQVAPVQPHPHPQFGGRNSVLLVGALPLSEQVRVPVSTYVTFPVCTAQQHTMNTALDAYVLRACL